MIVNSFYKPTAVSTQLALYNTFSRKIWLPIQKFSHSAEISPPQVTELPIEEIKNQFMF